MTITKGLVLTLIIGLAMAAVAAPNLLGPTGLLNIPTADTLRDDEYNVSAFNIDGVDPIVYSFNFGVRDNLEAGFTRGADKLTTVNLKYNFKPMTEKNAGISMGILDATNQVNTTIYTVMGKAISTEALYGITNLHLHAGLASGKSGEQRPLNNLFFGANFDVQNKLTVMLEYDGDNFNYGGRFALTKSVLLEAGSAGDEHDLVLGASFNSKF